MMKRILTSLYIIVSLAFTSFSQCSPADFTPLNLGNDTTICNGENFVINLSGQYSSFLWENNSTAPFRFLTNAGTYSVTVTGGGSNLITNGDFESGNTGFTSDYTPGSGGTWGTLSNAGEFDISTSPSLSHNNFTPCTDQTTGTGNMFVVNGASTPDALIWCQTVNVTPNTDYNFSFWVTNALSDPSVGSLQLFINNTAVGGVFLTSPTGCNWEEFIEQWNSGTATTAEICIRNQNTLNSGNDFAIDDITFSPLCSSYDEITLAVESPNQSITSVNPTCVGIADGSIEITSTNGTEFSIDGGVTYQVSNLFTGLNDGSFMVCTKTMNECEICEEVTLTPAPAVMLEVSNDTTICENGTATLVANAVGGNTFEYNWDMTSNLGNTQSIMPTINTTYTVFAENENGCQSNPFSINVTLYDPISGSISSNTTICSYEEDIFTTTANGGLNGYNYSWIGPNGTLGNTDSQLALGNNPGAYSVTITDGCESSALVLTSNLTQAATPIPSFTILENDLCEPAVFELTNTSTNSFSTTWNIESLSSITGNSTINSDVLWAGTYNVEMIVSSDEECKDTVLFSDALNVIPQPIADFTQAPNPVYMFNPSVVFTNQSQDASIFSWTMLAGSPNTSTEQNPSTQFPDGVTGDYPVELIATSPFGCSDTIVKIVTVYPEVILYAPNTFTPDGDEFNQTWRVYAEGIDIFDFQLDIYDRWGEKIFQSNNPDASWDGTYNGKIVPLGTYTWFIKSKDVLNDNVRTFSGHINVLR